MKLFLIISIVFCSFLLSAQDVYYSSPVKIPMLLSGSFAELRNSHFHSGIDIKTQGKTGLPVYAVADGHVSRILVSPSGYGNALYIDHDNGTTSVYAHLNKFRPDFENFIKNHQYENRSFQADIPVLPGIFQVYKNDMIALSGNSGSSEGPHLHFELRNTKTENPVNPLKFGFMIKDETAPKIYALQLSPLSESSHVNHSPGKVIFETEFVNGKYRLKNNLVVPVYGAIGFAIEANDFVDGSANKCGINFMELSIDGNIYSTFEINHFFFDDSGKIKGFIDFEEFIKSNRRFQRTWISTCNQLKQYDFLENNGILDPMIGTVHQIKIEIRDAHHNSSVLEFSVEGKYREMPPLENNCLAVFECGSNNQFSTDDFTIDLKNDVLYETLCFQYQSRTETNGYFSEIHEIHKNTTPLNKPATIRIKTKNLPENISEKALFVKIDALNGNISAAGGKYDKGWVSGQINSFGNYAVVVDTVPPTVLPLSISRNNTLTEPDKLRFKINDELSGIDKIEGWIDGKWALFEYDKKNSLITHYFDSERFELNKQHLFKLTVTDTKQNFTVYEASFFK